MPELPQEYIDYLKENLSALEKLSDGLSSTDERIDWIVSQLGVITNIKSSIDALVSQLANLGVLMTGVTRQIKFKETIVSKTGNIFRKRSEWDGILTSCTIHWPPGCNALVDVAVGIRGEHLFPKEGYLALDSATPVWPTHEIIRKHDEFWVDIANHDGVNDHTISVILTLQEQIV